MRTTLWVVAIVCLSAGVLPAEDKPNPDQLKKAYDDALGQLKAAQNSKNELARQNEKLSKEVEDLRKQLSAAQGQIQDLSRQVAENEQKDFDLRSCYAAWQAFLRARPELRLQWKLFLGDDPLALPAESRPLIDPNWLLQDRTESARG